MDRLILLAVLGIAVSGVIIEQLIDLVVTTLVNRVTA